MKITKIKIGGSRVVNYEKLDLELEVEFSEEESGKKGFAEGAIQKTNIFLQKELDKMLEILKENQNSRKPEPVSAKEEPKKVFLPRNKEQAGRVKINGKELSEYTAKQWIAMQDEYNDTSTTEGYALGILTGDIEETQAPQTKKNNSTKVELKAYPKFFKKSPHTANEATKKEIEFVSVLKNEALKKALMAELKKVGK